MKFILLCLLSINIISQAYADSCEVLHNQVSNDPSYNALKLAIEKCEFESAEGNPIAMYAAYSLHTATYFTKNSNSWKPDTKRNSLRNESLGNELLQKLIKLGSFKAMDRFISHGISLAMQSKDPAHTQLILSIAKKYSQIDTVKGHINPIALLRYSNLLSYQSEPDSYQYIKNNYKAIKYKEIAILEIIKNPNWVIYLSDFVTESIKDIGIAYAFGKYELPIDFTKAYAYLNAVGAHDDYRIKLNRDLNSRPQNPIYPQGLSLSQIEEGQFLSREIDTKIIEPIKLNTDYFGAIKFEIKRGIINSSTAF